MSKWVPLKITSRSLLQGGAWNLGSWFSGKSLPVATR